MAARKSPERLGAVIQNVVRGTAEKHRVLFGIQRRWKRLVGASLAAHTKPVSLRRGRLVVHADRPGDSYALNYQRAELLQRVRQSGGESVEEIILRPGTSS